jgi:hypothetical protein
MAQALRRIEPETRSYYERILKLVEADKVGEPGGCWPRSLSVA